MEEEQVFIKKRPQIPISCITSTQQQHSYIAKKIKPEEEQQQPMILGSSTSTTKPEKVPDLPCSIMIQILGRMPLKSLMDLRFVCKSWKSLLSESYFYTIYSQHIPTALILQTKGTSLDSLKQIYIVERVCNIPCVTRTRKMRFSRNQDKNSDNKEDLGHLAKSSFQMGNGCNGLVCVREVSTREPTLVWNPIMGQFAVLPKPASTSDNKVVAGFGYCGRTNRYKVLRVFHNFLDLPSRWRVEIYDLGVGERWRGIGYAPYPIPSRIPGFYTNNSLHWILDFHDKNNPNGNLIGGFDFVEENFKVIPPPPIFSLKQKDEYHWSNLGIIFGCLSICAIPAKTFRPDLQVWVMKEYLEAKSWTKRLSIRDPVVDWWDPYRWIQVINFVKDEEILMLCSHSYILAYSIRERRYRTEALSFSAIAHVPGFVNLENVLNKEQGTGSLTVRYL